MSETYNDRHDSKIYGARLIIYRRGDVENASFTFRAKIAGQKGYIRRNTKSDDPARAMLLLLSSAQKPRTLYSLRHFYAISRLRQGVDVFRLAENMGTGVTQIRNHYGRHISGDAYVKELTKYESKSVSKVKNDALAKLVEMVQTGIIDEDMALEAFKNVAAGRFGPITTSKSDQETTDI